MTAPLAWRDMGGVGRTLVVVHGFTGSSDDFASVVAPLCELRRVVLVDQTGHGESPRSPSYDYDSLTAALVSFITGQMPSRVDLLGHSLGGRVVLPIAVRNSQLVRSLVLMDTWADDPDRGAASDELEEIWSLLPDEALRRMAAFGTDRPDPEGELIAARWGAEWNDRRLADNARRVDAAVIIELGPAVFVAGPSVPGECRKVGCPTTVMVGSCDMPFLGPSARLADAIPGARLRTIEGAFHSPQLTHPEEWAEVVMDHLRWVDEVDPAP